MKRLTPFEFIEKAVAIHGDKYDYSKIEYVYSDKTLPIICKKHNYEFLKKPNLHLKGSGCPICSGFKKKTTDEFIRDAKKVHGEKFQYDKVNYVNNKTNVIIICYLHGKFEQTPKNHLNGKGCKDCAGKIKLTTEKFIEKAKRVHGDKYTYDNVTYVNYSTKVKITCPNHGDYLQTPDSHLSGSGCEDCSGKKKKTTDEFVISAKKIHGNKYIYDKVNYKNRKTNVIIICREHEDFKQTPSNHLQGNGCPKCYGKMKLTTEKFIEKAIKIHGDKYGYKNVNYVNYDTEVKITCPFHKVFLQTPDSHLKGSGCPKCNGKKKIKLDEFIKIAKEVYGDKNSYEKTNYIDNYKSIIITCKSHKDFERTPIDYINGKGCDKCLVNYKNRAEKFIKKAKLIHSDKYSYGNVNYVNSTTNVSITCPIHGDFQQIPSSHLSGRGCNKCGGKIKLTTEKFIEKAKLIHGDRYSYGNVNYINSTTSVSITCPYHGDYPQTPDNHLSGRGCKKCKYSKGEAAIDTVLKKLNIEFNSQHRFEDCVYKRSLVFDFAIFVNGQVGLIEFHGEQHYNKISFFDKSKHNAEAKIRDEIKLNYAITKNIKLLIIPFTQIDNIEQLIREFVSENFQ